MWVGGELLAEDRRRLCPCGTQEPGSRAGWRVGGNGRCLSTCYIHVWGGPGQLHARLDTGSYSTLLTMILYQTPKSSPGFLRVKACGGNHTHFPPPLKIYVYM